MRRSVIETGLGVMGATRLHRIAGRLTRGMGAILTFHHVRPERPEPYAPNRGLSVTPEHLEGVIRLLRERRYALVSIGEAVHRLLHADERERFAVLTFDDGFADNLHHAMPVLERHAAPGTFYIATGYASRTARLWWVELEEAIRRLPRVRAEVDGQRFDLPAGTAAEKTRAFETLYWPLRDGPEEHLLDVIGRLADEAGVDRPALVRSMCLDWEGVGALAASPLVTIGAHTVSHPRLAKHDEARVRRELAESRATLQEKLGRPVLDFAYPVGDPTSAGVREFRLAAEAGYRSGVTTRPGVLYPQHRDRLTALPRLSVNGFHQSRQALDVLVSGLPVVMWNKGRRVPAL